MPGFADFLRDLFQGSGQPPASGGPAPSPGPSPFGGISFPSAGDLIRSQAGPLLMGGLGGLISLAAGGKHQRGHRFGPGFAQGFSFGEHALGPLQQLAEQRRRDEQAKQIALINSGLVTTAAPPPPSGQVQFQSEPGRVQSAVTRMDKPTFTPDKMGTPVTPGQVTAAPKPSFAWNDVGMKFYPAEGMTYGQIFPNAPDSLKDKPVPREVVAQLVAKSLIGQNRAPNRWEVLQGLNRSGQITDEQLSQAALQSGRAGSTGKPGPETVAPPGTPHAGETGRPWITPEGTADYTRWLPSKPAASEERPWSPPSKPGTVSILPAGSKISTEGLEPTNYQVTKGPDGSRMVRNITPVPHGLFPRLSKEDYTNARKLGNEYWKARAPYDQIEPAYAHAQKQAELAAQGNGDAGLLLIDDFIKVARQYGMPGGRGGVTQAQYNEIEKQQPKSDSLKAALSGMGWWSGTSLYPTAVDNIMNSFSVLRGSAQEEASRLRESYRQQGLAGRYAPDEVQGIILRESGSTAPPEAGSAPPSGFPDGSRLLGPNPKTGKNVWLTPDNQQMEED